MVGAHGEAAVRLRLGAQVAADGLGAFAHADDAVAGVVQAGPSLVTVIRSLLPV
ncbi:hypothetical protein ACFV1W_21025 [Kitasatospora sp. NPDC059648]|uniref:hypothetical protein n=1 Tax=Kitasatospora sp. NPDC059648 TaxID=3346894 RepID=UPI0036CD7505